MKTTTAVIRDDAQANNATPEMIIPTTSSRFKHSAAVHEIRRTTDFFVFPPELRNYIYELVVYEPDPIDVTSPEQIATGQPAIFFIVFFNDL